MQLLFVAHGSPSPLYRQQAEAFLGQWQQAHPNTTAMLSYIEMAPFFHDVLDACAGEWLVVPLFLHVGKHLRHDVWDVAEQARANGKNLHMLPALNDGNMMADVLAESLREAGASYDVVVVFSHGSRADAKHQVLHDMLGYAGKYFTGTIAVIQGEPTLSQTLLDLVQQGKERIVIVPHLLFGGAWQDKANADIACIAATNQVNIIMLQPLVSSPALMHAITHLIAAHPC